MSVLLQIPDVPDEVHRTLQVRAAAYGLTLNEYVNAILARSVARPTPEDSAAQIADRRRVRLDDPNEAIVRQGQDVCGSTT